MASFYKNTFGRFETITLCLDNGAEAVLLPEVGAHLLSLKLPSGKGPVAVIDGYKKPEELGRLSGAKSSKLSPFPNRIAKGVYSFNGKKYQIPPENRPNAIHGFVRKEAFVAKEPSLLDDGISLELNYTYGGERPGYPFPFTMQLFFCLNEKGLHIKTLTRNEGDTPLPYGDGWHPYFQLQNGLVNELELRLPPCLELETERMIPTMKGKVMKNFQTYEPIGQQLFDTGFHLLNKAQKSVISLQNPSKNLELHLQMDSGKGQYRYFQLYIPPHRKSIAIEPMSCAADAFNNEMGLLLLQPKAAFEASFSILLNKLVKNY